MQCTIVVRQFARKCCLYYFASTCINVQWNFAVATCAKRHQWLCIKPHKCRVLYKFVNQTLAWTLSEIDPFPCSTCGCFSFKQLLWIGHMPMQSTTSQLTDLLGYLSWNASGFEVWKLVATGLERLRPKEEKRNGCYHSNNTELVSWMFTENIKTVPKVENEIALLRNKLNLLHILFYNWIFNN